MSTTTLGDLVRGAQQAIAANGSESPRLDAEILMRYLLDIDRVALFLRLEEVAPAEIAETYATLVQRRLDGQPIAYLTGRREFMGMSFQVTSDVLIPRPETELLVEWALEWIAARDTLTVIDVGTGSGAIAVSIAGLDTSERNTVIASDVSASALQIAEQNADRLLTPFRRRTIDFQQGSLLDWRREPVDLVLSNLPYLTPEQITENSDLAAEPRLALDGGGDGLDLVRRLAADLPRVLHAQGAVGLELDPVQIDATIRLLRAEFPDARIGVIEDLAGHRRHVTMTR